MTDIWIAEDTKLGAINLRPLQSGKADLEGVAQWLADRYVPYILFFATLVDESNEPKSDIPGGEWVKVGQCPVDSAEIGVRDPAMTSNEFVSIMPSGLGDGIYDVYARMVEIEPGDTRAVEFRVVLITAEQLRYWGLWDA